MKSTLAACCLVSLAGAARADVVAFNNFGPGDTYHGNGWIIYGPQATPLFPRPPARSPTWSCRSST